MRKNFFKYALVASIALVTASCSERFTDTVFNQSVEQSTFTSVEELEATMNGAYGSMRNVGYYGRDFNMYSELRSEYMYSTAASGRYTTVAALNANGNHMLSTDSYASGTYNAIYTVIAKANIVINSPDAGLTWKNSIDPAAIKTRIQFIKAQAYAIRAQAFFDLLRLFGQKYVTGGTLGVVLPTKYDPTAVMARASITETETQIDGDFTKAIALSTGAKSNDAYGNKTILNSTSIKGLASRFYLYKQDYAKVRTLVNDVVASGRYSVVAKDLLVTSWSMNNAAPNSIFEVAVGVGGSLGSDSYYNIMHSSGAYKNIKLRTAGYNLYSTTDARKALTFKAVNETGAVTGYYVNKYTNLNGEDNVKMLRFEEVLLNGIEAELNGGDPAKAAAYYKLIFDNRYTSGTAPATVTLDMLKKERALELMGEGFRMWDNFRWGVGVPYSTNKGAANTAFDLPYGSPYLAFPIPRAEFSVPNNKMVQNAGYDN